MNSAFTHHHGAKKAGRLVCSAALACALVLGGGSAWAQQHGDRRDDQGAQQYPQQQYPQQSPRFRLPPQDRGQRDDSRGYDDQRRAPPQYQQDQRDQQHDSRRSGRMTPDERRDLRRQINEAGMDLYPPKRR